MNSVHRDHFVGDRLWVVQHNGFEVVTHNLVLRLNRVAGTAHAAGVNGYRAFDTKSSGPHHTHFFQALTEPKRQAT